MRALRFGIIGLGNVAPMHAEAIGLTEGAELVAVADSDRERGAAFGARYRVRCHARYQDLLACDDVDAVCICTPHDLHSPMTIEAAQTGKHVLCEKPMARNLAECDRMIAACERAGVTLAVVFPVRSEPLAAKLKAAIDGGELGRLLWASANTLWYRSAEYYRSAAWRGTWEHEGGGVLINQGIHGLDLLLWTAGMPVAVTSRMRTLDHAVEVEDAALAVLEYGDGGLGLVQATTVAYPGFPEYFEYFGSAGSAVYRKGEGRLEWHLARPPHDRVDETEAAGGAAASPTAFTAAAHTRVVRDFVAGIREGRRPMVDGAEARRSIELVEAIYRSARRQTCIELPLAAEDE